MKKFVFVSLAFLCSTLSALPVISGPIILEGRYDCTGTEIDTETVFQCDETITKTGETYAFTAACNDGTSYVGTGIYQPANRDLSIVFRNVDKIEEIGVSVKHVSVKTGELLGKWTNLNKTAVGHTWCIKRENG